MRQNPVSQKDIMDALSQVLAVMRATQWSHQTSHWQCSGENFYSDHKLFKKLYNSLNEEIDTLAEKMVCYFKSPVVGAVEQIERTHEILADKELYKTDAISRAIRLEKTLLAQISFCFKILSDSNALTLGLDDFLSAAANNHETNLYLLSQRAEVSRG